jgi:protein-disulfide isomerase
MGKDRVEAGRKRGTGQGVVKKSGARGGGKQPFYILLALFLVIGIGTISYLAVKPSGNVSQVDTTVAPIPNQGHVMGSDSAILEVVEYGDFECPACASFATLTEPDVRARLVNTGLIRFRFMDYPLPNHPNTWPAHLASWCAAEQGKFWQMHDVIYQNQDRWNAIATSRPERVLGNLARQIGVNADQFEGCMESRKYHPQIRANSEQGVRLQVNGTPTFIIGSKQIADPLSYDEFKRYVDEALAQARAAKAPAAKTPATKK